MDMVNKCQCGFETPLAKCPKCGVALVEPKEPAENILVKQYQSPITLGGFILLIGFAAAVYFFVGFDTSVSSGVGRVNNLGLMNDRIIGIILSVAVMFLGMFTISSERR